MAGETAYQSIVIGSGQGGTPLSLALAEAGRRTALIEREHVGGTCVNEGCTPTKTMVASGRVAYLARRGGDYGVVNRAIEVEMTKVRQRKRDIVESFRSGSQDGAEKTPGLDLLMGEASFMRPKTLKVRMNSGDERILTGEQIFINTGARPNNPSIEGLDGVPTLNSTSIMELAEVPEHLLVVGGGYIGLEFAQMFRRFGSKVTIIHRGSQLLSREDTDVAEEVARIMNEDGLDVLLNADVMRVRAEGKSNIAITIKLPDAEREIQGSHLLMAVGRVPNTDRLNLDAAGIETDQQGFVKVNDKLETNVQGVFAIGDVKGGPAFTHISYDDFRIIRTNLLEGGDASIRGRMVPYTVFIDPQLGRVGMTEAQAREQGHEVHVAKMPMSHVARALEMDESRGFMKAVVDAKSKQILGCSILGIEGGELMSMIEIAMMGKVLYTQLREGIFAHPTLAESLNNLFATIEDG